MKDHTLTLSELRIESLTYIRALCCSTVNGHYDSPLKLYKTKHNNVYKN